MAKERTIADVQADLMKQLEEEHKLGEKRDTLQNELDTLRVSEMDKSVVDEAMKLGVNPKNFEDTDHLKEAIKLAKKSL